MFHRHADTVVTCACTGTVAQPVGAVYSELGYAGTMKSHVLHESIFRNIVKGSRRAEYDTELGAAHLLRIIKEQEPNDTTHGEWVAHTIGQSRYQKCIVDCQGWQGVIYRWLEAEFEGGEPERGRSDGPFRTCQDSQPAPFSSQSIWKTAFGTQATRHNSDDSASSQSR